MAKSHRPRNNEDKTVVEINGDIPVPTPDRETVRFARDFEKEDNQAPQLSPLSDLDAHPGVPVTFTATAYDPDGDDLSFSLLNGPPGATITTSGTMGTFEWTPTWSQLGAWTVTVVVTDTDGLYDTRSCTVTVGNQPPQLDPLDDLTAHPGVPVMFTAVAYDPDGDSVTFSLVNAPPGATLSTSGNLGTFSWTPGWNQLGARTITVRVTDQGGLSVSQSCTITVGNEAPTLAALYDVDAHPGVPVEFTAVAYDADGDNVTFSLVNPPAGATITTSGNLGTFSWTPTWSQLGARSITVRATDQGGLSDSQSCTITVGNQPPVLTGMTDPTVQVGNGLSIPVTATDPDGDALTFELVNPPAGATITSTGGNTATVSWTPTAGQEGAATLTVRVSDQGGLSDVRSCTVTVEPAP